MIYIISHLPYIRYSIPVEHKIIRSDLTGMADYWKECRGIKAILSIDHSDEEEIGNFQYRRYLNWFGRIPDGYDCIGGKPFFTAFKPYDQYVRWHHLSDIAIIEHLVNDESFSRWLHTYQLPCYDSMFIMKKDLWIECFSWAMAILEQWDKHPDRSHDTGYQSQAPGFLLERLTGWWTSRLNILKVDRIELNK